MAGDNSDYTVVDIQWRTAKMTLQVVKIPEDKIGSKLATLSASAGLSRIEYLNFLIGKCLIDQERVTQYINSVSTEPATDLELIGEVAQLIIRVNPLLDPALLSISEDGNVVPLSPNEPSTRLLVDNPSWDMSFEDLVSEFSEFLVIDDMPPGEFDIEQKMWEEVGVPIPILKLKDEKEELDKFFSSRSTFTELIGYKGFVIQNAIVDFHNTVLMLEHLGVSHEMSSVELTDKLFALVVDVNPFLAIDAITERGIVTIKKAPIPQAPTRRTKSDAKAPPATKGATAGTDAKTATDKAARTFSSVTPAELLELNDKLNARVIGQPQAVAALCETLQVAGAGLRDPEKPLGTFLLTGETGVGKTYLAKMLSEILVGSATSMVRIDCSEYGHAHEVSKLIGCFTADTEISMRGGAVKPISEVKVGDEVLTYNGGVEKVLETFEYPYSGTMYNVRVAGDNRTIECTPKHEFYAIRTDRCWHSGRDHVVCKPSCSTAAASGLGCSDHKFEEYKPEWVMAKDLREGDIVLYPRYKQARSYPDTLDLASFDHNANKDASSVWYQEGSRVNRFVGLNREFVRLAGYYVSEGGSDDSRVDFSFHTKEVAYQEEVAGLVEAIFGKECSFSTSPAEKTAGKQRSRAYVCSKSAARMFSSLFGHGGASNKKLPEWWLDLPETLLREFVQTAVFGDGCSTITRRVDYSTVSPTLANQMRQVLHKLGFMCQVSLETAVPENCSPRYRLYISGDQISKFEQEIPTGVLGAGFSSNIQRMSYTDDNYVYRQIRSINTVDFDGTVHDFKVEKDVSYQVFGVAVHNSPPGYIGHDAGGQLTNKVAQTPFSIVLFDEVEKAHSKLYDILLQILDEGRLTDGKGVTVDFSDCVVLMTSNIGVRDVSKIGKTVGFGDVTSITQDKRANAIGAALRRHFKPEFLNRLDGILTFNALGKEDSRKIARLTFKDVGNYLEEKNVTLEPTDALIEYVLDKGFSPEYGARALKRTIESTVVKPLAIKMLSEKVIDNCKVHADYVEGKVVFEFETVKPAKPKKVEVSTTEIFR